MVHAAMILLSKLLEMNSPSPVIHSIFIGQPKDITDVHGTWCSSIYRECVDGPVQVELRGLKGDQAAQPYHGGPDGAICCHLLEHYRFWNERYGMNLGPGSVGENFTLENASEDDICAGDIYRVGTALVQVSGPRIPCANQARRIGRADWVKLTIKELRTGFYLRVLAPGILQAGDIWRLHDRPSPEATITSLNYCFYHTFDPELAQRFTQVQGLSDYWKERFAEKLVAPKAHWSADMTA
jgi:MOSC domain-containing protein YiiM